MWGRQSWRRAGLPTGLTVFRLIDRETSPSRNAALQKFANTTTLILRKSHRRKQHDRDQKGADPLVREPIPGSALWAAAPSRSGDRLRTRGSAPQLSATYAVHGSASRARSSGISLRIENVSRNRADRNEAQLEIAARLPIV